MLTDKEIDALLDQFRMEIFFDVRFLEGKPERMDRTIGRALRANARQALPAVVRFLEEATEFETDVLLGMVMLIEDLGHTLELCVPNPRNMPYGNFCAWIDWGKTQCAAP